MGDICAGLGYERPHIHLPFMLVMFIACFVQYVVIPIMAVFGKRIQTDFTPFRMTLAAVNRTFDCTAARKDFGYVPQVSVKEGLQRTLAHFECLKRDQPSSKTD